MAGDATCNNNLVEKPDVFINLVGNVISIFDTDVVLGEIIFARSFLERYIPADDYKFYITDDRKDVAISGFKRMYSHKKQSDNELKDVSINIGRGLNKPTGRVSSINCQIDMVGSDALHYEEIMDCFRNRLIPTSFSRGYFLDPGKNFPSPQISKYGNSFYSCRLDGSFGDKQALVKVGPVGNVELVLLSVGAL